MKLLLLSLALIATGCAMMRPTATDSQGRVFVLVREAQPVGNGIVDAELWQRTDATGPAHPYYLRLLPTDGQPPQFTRAL